MNWKAPDDYQTNPTYFSSSIGQNGSYGTHDRFLVAHWGSVISTTMVNDFRFQYSRDFEFYSANTPAQAFRWDLRAAAEFSLMACPTRFHAPRFRTNTGWSSLILFPLFTTATLSNLAWTSARFMKC